MNFDVSPNLYRIITKPSEIRSILWPLTPKIDRVTLLKKKKKKISTGQHEPQCQRHGAKMIVTLDIS